MAGGVSTSLKVKPRIGVLGGVAFNIGTIIGSGIFVSPKGVYEGTGSVGLCLVVWTLCGVIGIAGAFVYADLGLLIPRSGADYTYQSVAIGKFPAFWFIWVQVLVVYPMAHVIKALTVGEYLTALVLTGECGHRELVKRLIAATVIVTITIMNVTNVRMVTRTQIFLMVIKVAALVVIIGGGLVYCIQNGTVGNLQEGFDGTNNDITKVAAAMYSGIWAYAGWNTLNFSIEEVSRPRRTLPLAIAISVFLVLVLYVLVNVSYLAVLSREEFLSSWAVGVSWEGKVFGGGSFMIPLVVVLSVFGSGHGTAFASARLSYAAARDETFPEFLSFINIHSMIPSAAVLLTSGLALIYLSLPGDVGKIINVTGFIGAGFQALTFICHIILSVKMRDVDRPIKVPIVVSGFMVLIFIYLFVAPLIGGKLADYIFPLSFLGAGIVIYFPFVLFKLHLPCFDYFVIFTQLLLGIAPPDRQSDARVSLDKEKTRTNGDSYGSFSDTNNTDMSVTYIPVKDE